MSRRSSYKGINKLRRTLRRMEPAASDHVKEALIDVAEAIKWTAVSNAPVQYGDLQASIDYKVSRDGFGAVIGPGANAVEFMRSKKATIFSRRFDIKITPARSHDLMQALKAFWLEFGTKHIAARPFMQPAFDTNATWAKGEMRNAIKKALREATK